MAEPIIYEIKKSTNISVELKANVINKKEWSIVIVQ